MIPSHIEQITHRSTELHEQYDAAFDHLEEIYRRQDRARAKLFKKSMMLITDPYSLLGRRRENKQMRLRNKLFAVSDELPTARERCSELVLAAKEHYVDNRITYYDTALLEATKAKVSIVTEDTVNRHSVVDIGSEGLDRNL